jgi:hypothetical protein
MTNAELLKAVEALVTQNENLAAKLAAIAAAASTLGKLQRGELVSTPAGPEKPGRKYRKPRTPKAKVEAGSKVIQGPAGTRGRKPKFTAEQAANMAQAASEGTPVKDIAATYQASLQTIQRTIARANGHASA